VLRAWNGWNRVLTMSFENFAKDFANGVPASEQRAAYDRHVVPTPGRIYFQAALWIGTGVNWSNPDRAPLLLIAGGEDRTVEQSMVEAAWHNHSRSPAKTAFMAFPGRSHFICGEPGWEEVADYAIRWVSENRKPEG
jgi:alpha-beta hydrolase superfamily lysophospholipase